MDVLPVLHFVFIALPFLWEGITPPLGSTKGRWKETQDANLEVGRGDRKGCLLSLGGLVS